jgi:hypothetical protein
MLNKNDPGAVARTRAGGDWAREVATLLTTAPSAARPEPPEEAGRPARLTNWTPFPCVLLGLATVAWPTEGGGEEELPRLFVCARLGSDGAPELFAAIGPRAFERAVLGAFVDGPHGKLAELSGGNEGALGGAVVALVRSTNPDLLAILGKQPA